MSYEMKHSNSHGSGGDCLRVKIFADRAVTQNQLNTAYYATEDAVADIVYDNRHAPNVEFGEIEAYTTDQLFTCPHLGDNVSDSQKARNEDRILEEFNNWLDTHDFSERGCYLWLTNCHAGRTDGNAWHTRATGVMSVDRYNYIGPMTVHEAFHAYITEECDYVANMLPDGEDEHYLATVDYADNLTPLAVSYSTQGAPRYHKNGECSDQNFSSVRERLSSCAKEAVNLTLGHKNYTPHIVW